MDNLGSVAILGCTRNRGWSLERALSSILDDVARSSLANDPSLEIIVVDNGSTDDTASRLASLSKREPRLRSVVESVPGVSVARNRALRETTADILVWFDDDITVKPGWLDAHLSVYASHPQCAGVGGAIALAFDTHRPWWLGPRLESYLAAYHIDQNEVSVRRADQLLPFGANMSLRRQVLVDAGGFDEHLGRVDRSLISGEETAALEAIVERGGQLFLCGTAQVLHNIPEHRTRFRWMAARLYAQGRTDRRLRRRIALPLVLARTMFGGVRYLVKHATDLQHAVPEYVTQRCYWAGYFVEALLERRRRGQ